MKKRVIKLDYYKRGNKNIYLCSSDMLKTEEYGKTEAIKMIRANELEIVNMKLVKENGTYELVDNLNTDITEEYLFYLKLLKAINENSLSVSFMFNKIIQKLRDLLDRKDKTVLKLESEKQFARHLFEILKHFTIFFEDIKTKNCCVKLVEYGFDFNSIKSDVQEQLQNIPKKFRTLEEIKDFEKNLEKPMSMKYIVEIVSKYWKEENIDDNFSAVCLNIISLMYSTYGFTDDGLNITPVYLKNISNVLLKYIHSDDRIFSIKDVNDTEREEILLNVKAERDKKVRQLEEKLKELNKKYGLYVRINLGKIFKVLQNIFISSSKKPISKESYRMALTDELKEVNTFVSILNKAYEPIFVKQRKVCDFIEDMLRIYSLSKELENFYFDNSSEIEKDFAPFMKITSAKKFVLFKMKQIVSPAIQRFFEYFDKCTDYELEILKMFMQIGKNLSIQCKESLTFDNLLVPSYFDIKCISDFVKYRDAIDEQPKVQGEYVYFLQLSWLTAYSLYMKRFKGLIMDEFAPSFVWQLYKNILNVFITLYEKRFEVFLESYRELCEQNGLYCLNFTEKKINCENFYIANILAGNYDGWML